MFLLQSEKVQKGKLFGIAYLKKALGLQGQEVIFFTKEHLHQHITSCPEFDHLSYFDFAVVVISEEVLSSVLDLHDMEAL